MNFNAQLHSLNDRILTVLVDKPDQTAVEQYIANRPRGTWFTMRLDNLHTPRTLKQNHLIHWMYRFLALFEDVSTLEMKELMISKYSPMTPEEATGELGLTHRRTSEMTKGEAMIHAEHLWQEILERRGRLEGEEKEMWEIYGQLRANRRQKK